MSRFRLKLKRRVKPEGPEDQGPPAAEDLSYGCVGCVWAALALFGILALTLLLNKCGR